MKICTVCHEEKEAFCVVCEKQVALNDGFLFNICRDCCICGKHAQTLLYHTSSNAMIVTYMGNTQKREKNMTDKYRTHWIITSLNNSKWMRFSTDLHNEVEMQPAINCDDPIEFNTKRDCGLFLKYLGLQEEDYCMIEREG